MGAKEKEAKEMVAQSSQRLVAYEDEIRYIIVYFFCIIINYLFLWVLRLLKKRVISMNSEIEAYALRGAVMYSATNICFIILCSFLLSVLA